MIMIETSRLFLREMGPEDFDALYAMLAIEAHQDRVLNEIAAQEDRDTD